MPVVRMPDGQLVRFPDEMPAQEIQAKISSGYPGAYDKPKPALADVMDRAMNRGAANTYSTLGDDLPAYLASIMGKDDYAKAQLAEGEEYRAAAAAKNPAYYEDWKDVASPSDAAGFVTEKFFENAPMLAGLAGTAITGAVAAPLIGASAATGATLSAALGTYSLMAPETFAGIYAETGDLAPGASTLAGAVNTALELVTPVGVIKSFGPRMKEAVVSKLLEKSGMERSLIASAVKGTARGMATEGFTEGSQDIVNQNAEKFVAGNPMFESMDWERAVSNAVAGAAVGIPLGGVGGVGRGLSDRGQLRQENARQEEEAALVTPEDAEPVVAKDPLAAEPVVATADPRVIPVDAKELKAWGLANLGVGPTATILKPGGVLAGKDLNDPVQAAEVKTELEKYLATLRKDSSVRPKVAEAIRNLEPTGISTPEGGGATAPEVIVDGEIEARKAAAQKVIDDAAAQKVIDDAAADKVIVDGEIEARRVADEAAAEKFVDDIPLEKSIWSKDLLGFLTTEYEFTNAELNQLNAYDEADMRGYLAEIEAQDGLVFSGPLTDEVLSSTEETVVTEEVADTGEGVAKDETKAKVLFNEYGLTEADSAALTNEEFDDAFTKAQEDIQLREAEAAQVTPLSAEQTEEKVAGEEAAVAATAPVSEETNIKLNWSKEAQEGGKATAKIKADKKAAKVIQDKEDALAATKEDALAATKETNRIATEAEQTRDAKARAKVKAKVDRLAYRDKGLAAAVKADVNKFKSENTTTPYKKGDKPLLGKQAAANYMLAYPDVGDALAVLAAESKLDFTESKRFSITDTSDKTKALEERKRVVETATKAIKWINSNLSPDTRAALAENIAFVEQEIENKKTGAKNREREDARNDEDIRKLSGYGKDKSAEALKNVTGAEKGKQAVNKRKKKAGLTSGAVEAKGAVVKEADIKEEPAELEGADARTETIKEATGKIQGYSDFETDGAGLAGAFNAVFNGIRKLSKTAEAAAGSNEALSPIERSKKEENELIAALPADMQAFYRRRFKEVKKANPKYTLKKINEILVREHGAFFLKTPKYRGPDFSPKIKEQVAVGDLQGAIKSIIAERNKRGDSKEITALIGRINSQLGNTSVALDGPGIRAGNFDPLPAEALEVQEGVEGKTAVEAAKFISKNAPSKDLRVLATAVLNRLQELEKAGFPVSFEVVHVGDFVRPDLAKYGTRGVAVTRTYAEVKGVMGDLVSIAIFVKGADVTGEVGTSYETVLHELFHAVTVSTIVDVGGLNDAKTNAAVSELNQIFNFAIASIKKKERDKTLNVFEKQTFEGENNFLENPKELITWAITNRNAAEYLDSIPYKKGTLFTAFVRAMRNLLGLEEVSDTALAATIRVTEVLLGKGAVNAAMRSAKKVTGVEGAGIDVTTLPRFSSGAYLPGLDTVVLSTFTGLNEHTLLHESSHAALAQALNNQNLPVTKKFMEFFLEIKLRVGDAYGGTNLQEFAAEYVGNGEFQALLKTIKAPKSENMFIRILQTIAEFFGLRKSQTAYDTAFKFLNELLDVSQGVEPSLVDTLYLSNNADKVMAEVTDTLASRSLDKAFNQWSNIKDDSFKVTVLGAAGLNNIQSLAKEKLKAPIGALMTALERKRGEVNTKIDSISGNIRQMTGAERKATPAQRKAFNDLAIDSRLAHIDIFKPAPKGVKGKAEFKKLTNRYNQLTPDLQEAYKTLRADLDKSLKEYVAIITDLLPESASRELVKEFSTMEGVIGYVPFARSGPYWISYEDPSNLDAAGNPTHTPTSFPSIRERKIEMDRLEAKHPGLAIAQHTNVNSVKAPKGLPEGSFVTKLIGELRNSGVEESTIDQIYQQYITMFPANSIMQQFNKSLNKPGMDRDVITAYSDVAIKWANKIANTKYNPKIEQALQAIETTADAQYGGDPWSQAIKKSLRMQEKFFLNPQFAPLAANMTFLSYLEYIVGSVSSAVVNLTGLMFMVTPMLGARFTYPEALAALNGASSKIKLFALKENNWGTGKYSALYTELDARGLLKHTVAREAIERGKTKGKDFDGTFYKAVELFSIPFARSEQFMRSVTAVAAFDLAMKSGVPSEGVAAGNEKAAVAFAAKMVRDAHTGGMAETMPRWMQNDFGRVILTFKNIIFQQSYVVGEAIATIFSRQDLPIGVRRVAVRQVLGTFGLSFALLGAKGMPFIGAFATLMNIVAALVPDDEDETEPYDFMVEMEEVFDDYLYNGMLGSVLNVDISARAALANDILWRDDPKSIEDYGYVRTAMFTLGGPMASYAVGAERAITQDLTEGRYGRFAEGISPTFVRNGIKSYRFMQEGARNRDGDPIDTDINAWNLMVQSIGFAPADLSSTYRQRSAAKNYENKVLGRKQRILNKYTAAKKVGDTKRQQEAAEEANKFIRQYPTLMDRDTLERSYKANIAADKNSVAGISFTKGLRYKTDEFFE